VIPHYIECSNEYRQADDALRFAICNGCGSAQAKFDFVPDTLWGLSIKHACYVHDWDYHRGKTEQDKIDADLRFLRNMMQIIDHESVWLLKHARRSRALKYYELVDCFGDDAFWANKQRDEGNAE
jgi:hypothetical protein